METAILRAKIFSAKAVLAAREAELARAEGRLADAATLESITAHCAARAMRLVDELAGQAGRIVL